MGEELPCSLEGSEALGGDIVGDGDDEGWGSCEGEVEELHCCPGMNENRTF